MCQQFGSNVMKKSKARKLPQYGAAISVSIGSLAAGAALGWTGNISEDMKTLSFNGIQINDESLGWIGSLVTLGMAISSIPIGKLCDMFGRKTTMLSVTIPFIIGWLLILYANCLTMLYIGRFITGMSAGTFMVVSPIYISEIAEKDIRGSLGSYLECFVTLGIMIAYFTPMIVDMKTHTIIVGLTPLIFAAFFVFQPESPVFRMQQKKDNDARVALIQLRGKNYDVEDELYDMKPTHNEISIIDSLKKKGTQKALIASSGLMFFQAMTGVNAIVFYTDTILESSGSQVDRKKGTMLFGLIQVSFSIISCFIVDKFSRRGLLIFSNTCVACALILLGLYVTVFDRELLDQSKLLVLGYIPLISLIIYISVHSLAMSPVPWIINAELLPSEIKGPATGASATFNSFMAFITSKFFFDIKDNLGADINYYIFAVFTVLGIAFIYFYLPETKGKTLEQIQKELNE